MIDPERLCVELVRGDNQDVISVTDRRAPDAWPLDFTPQGAVAFGLRLAAEGTAALAAGYRREPSTGDAYPEDLTEPGYFDRIEATARAALSDEDVLADARQLRGRQPARRRCTHAGYLDGRWR